MEQVLAKLDETRKKMLALIESVTEEKFSARIVPEMWSIAENIHHLTIVENRYITEMQNKIKNPSDSMSALRRLFQVPGWFAGIRLVKVKAPKIAEPLNPPATKTETLNNFQNTRNHLKEICRQQGINGMQGLTLIHPFFGKMDGLNSVVFLESHEIRHYKQIIETLEKAN